MKDIDKPTSAETALIELADEIMSTLHASQLRNDTVNSAVVKTWLQTLHNITQAGLGRPQHFAESVAQPSLQADRPEKAGPSA